MQSNSLSYKSRAKVVQEPEMCCNEIKAPYTEWQIVRLTWSEHVAWMVYLLVPMAAFSFAPESCFAEAQR